MIGTKRILSPMATGNGAYELHRLLERHMPGYHVAGFNPYYAMVPFLIPFVVSHGKADLIHTVADCGIFFFFKKTPVVITVHHYMCDNEMDPYSSFLQRMHYRLDLKFYYKKSISLAAALTAVSQFTANHIKKEINPLNDIRVIYNGIEEDFFIPIYKKKQDSAIKVLFSGNLTKRKGAHWLPPIAAKLTNGIVIQHTKGLRKPGKGFSEGNIASLGHVPYTQMPAIYQSHDILLAPSVREGFGLAIAEAMACGLPVVASNCSAIPELIDDGKGGFLCPVGNVDEFAKKVNLLAESPGLRREMGEYNRAKVEEMFTLKRMVKEYQMLFEEVLTK